VLLIGLSQSICACVSLNCLLSQNSLTEKTLPHDRGGRVGNFRGMPVDGAVPGAHPHALTFWVICKYPPSLAYALITLGVDMSLLGAFARYTIQGPEDSLRRFPCRVLLAFGKCPLFFYIIHLWVINATSMLLNLSGIHAVHCGVPLPYALFIWAGILVLMFFLCEPYGRFKLRQPASSLWRFL
jgi:hypothetical protein